MTIDQNKHNRDNKSFDNPTCICENFVPTCVVKVQLMSFLIFIYRLDL
jgi:hypothetical protein